MLSMGGVMSPASPVRARLGCTERRRGCGRMKVVPMAKAGGKKEKDKKKGGDSGEFQTSAHKLTSAGQSRNREGANFDAKRVIQIEFTEKELDKIADKARRDAYYEAVLEELQIELVRLQEHLKSSGKKVLVICEGRDAAGKGGSISRIASAMSPRVCKVVALAAPNEREKTQWYFQRYIQHLPGAGEMVIFDRSWYNRAGVERVMGFCTDEEYDEFMRTVPILEETLIRSGIILIKYWFSVSDDEQEKRFQGRLNRSWKRWKLSPMDLFSRSKWVEYSKAKDAMFEVTDTKVSPWFVVPSDDKKAARLNMISHLLAQIDYDDEDANMPEIVLPPRQEDDGYKRPKQGKQNIIPQLYATDSSKELTLSGEHEEEDD